jgi:hypothetical protein
MTAPTESLLVIDNGRKFDSDCVNALVSLGYRDIVHVTFEEGSNSVSSLARFEAVVINWANTLAAKAVSMVVRAATSHGACAGGLMISPYCTSDNVKLFRSVGVCAWLRVPYTRRDLGARLRYTIEGERRQRRIPVLIERRRSLPMPAYA